METRLAHNLNENVWRSQDVNLNNYLKNDNQIEIKTPFQTSNDKDFLLKNTTENTTFSLIKINEKIVEDLKRCGFVWPSPIQTTCIPLGRLGIDLIAQSKSGTGKTIVFVVCALEMVLQTLSDEVPFPKVLILAPTREIAVQIVHVIQSLTVNWKNFSCYQAIGGTKVSENISKLDISQIIVGTPGRICCLLEMDFLKPHAIRMFILDECDKLMEENFKKQIDKIYNCLPMNKQMIVTSATMSTEMISYLSRYMRDPMLIRLNADKPSLIGVMQYILKVKGHCLDYMNFESKIDSLVYIIKNVQFTQCFIFLNHQPRVAYLYDRLNSEGMSVTYITGDMSQKERLQTIECFRNKKFKILVSTDLTSRGIDIESVNLVINVDVPFDCETYLHRIGRSGRFGSSGIAITIVGKNDEYEKFISTISQYNLQINELTLPLTMNLWDAFYQENSESINKCSLKLNPVFEQMKSMYKKLVNEPKIIEEINLNFVDQIKDCVNDDDLILKNNLEISYTLLLEELRLSLHELINPQTIVDEKTLNNDKLVVIKLNEQKTNNANIMEEMSPTENTNISLPIIQRKKKKRENDSNVPTKRIEKKSLFTMNELFRQTFLNPHYNSMISQNFYNHNLIICRYMLKGGKL